MAKKKEKDKERKASGTPTDVLRDAVERTFAGAAGGAAGAQKRVQEIFDDATSALTRLRDAVDERRLLEAVEQLRDEVADLNRRVAALEAGAAAAKPARSRAAARKPTSAAKTTPSKDS